MQRHQIFVRDPPVYRNISLAAFARRLCAAITFMSAEAIDLKWIQRLRIFIARRSQVGGARLCTRDDGRGYPLQRIDRWPDVRDCRRRRHAGRRGAICLRYWDLSLGLRQAPAWDWLDQVADRHRRLNARIAICRAGSGARGFKPLCTLMPSNTFVEDAKIEND